VRSTAHLVMAEASNDERRAIASRVLPDEALGYEAPVTSTRSQSGDVERDQGEVSGINRARERTVSREMSRTRQFCSALTALACSEMPMVASITLPSGIF
jgi:hypothetical protein